MQVSAHPRSQSSAAKYRAHVGDLVASIAGAADRSVGGGGQPSGSKREDQSAAADPRPERSGHKTVFLARALSSTLTELQMSSSAGETFDRSDRRDGAASSNPSLDDLLSSFLSAA